MGKKMSISEFGKQFKKDSVKRTKREKSDEVSPYQIDYYVNQ